MLWLCSIDSQGYGDYAAGNCVMLDNETVLQTIAARIVYFILNTIQNQEYFC